jgi:hypothetical protein
MGQFRDIDYDYSTMTLDEGIEIFRERDGIRISIGYGYACRGKTIPGPHWTGQWFGTRGCGNCGFHAIVPVSREARRYVREHVVTCWMERHGLTNRQANRLYDSRAAYRHENISVIGEAVADKYCHAAMREFAGVGPGCHGPWMAKWGDVVAPYIAKCTSWPRRCAMIEAVCDVIGPE